MAGVLTRKGIRGQTATHKLRGEASGESSTADTLIGDLQPAEPRDDTRLLLTPPRLRYFVMAALADHRPPFLLQPDVQQPQTSSTSPKPRS